jgi:acyl dehydratase
MREVPVRTALLPLGLAALASAAMACHTNGAPGAPAPIAPLFREGLDGLVGRVWRGDSAPLAGAQHYQGWLVMSGRDSAPPRAIVIFSVGDRQLVTFDVEVGRAADQAVWQTTDAAWLLESDTGDLIATLCRYGEASDGEVFALVHHTDTDWYRDIHAAWRANTATGRIEPAPTAGLACANESRGAGGGGRWGRRAGATARAPWLGRIRHRTPNNQVPLRRWPRMKPAVGDRASRSMVVTTEHVEAYAQLTGDYNPLHFDDAFARRTKFGARVVQGGLTTGLLHALVATDLPGPGTVFLSQNWKFTAPVYIGDAITAEAEVLSVHATKPVTQLRIEVRRQTGETVLEGEAWCYRFLPDG